MKDLFYVLGIVLIAIGIWLAIPVFAIIAGTGMGVLFLLEMIKEGKANDS